MAPPIPCTTRESTSCTSVFEIAQVSELSVNRAMAAINTLQVSSSAVMLGMSSGINTTSDIRFPVRGIIRYGALNKIFGHFCLVDIESYRECLGYFTAADMAAQVPKEEKQLLGLEGSDLDSLFGGDSMIVSGYKKAPLKIKLRPCF